MRVLALLPIDKVGALRRAYRHPQSVEFPRTLEHLLTALAGLESAVVVLDPLCLPDQAFDRFLTAVECSTARVLFLADLNSSSARRIIQAAERRIGDVVFADCDEFGPLLAAKLEASNDVTASVRVLRALTAETSALAHPVAVHSMSLFSGARVPSDVSCFAQRMSIPRRSLHRELTRVGLASASTLLAVARLARTWEHMSGEQLTDVRLVSEDFPSYRGLYTQYIHLVRLPPRRAARDLTADEFASRLACAARAQ